MTKKEVQEYIDDYISHAISMVEFGNSFVEDLDEYINAARDEIEAILESHEYCKTKKVCNEALAEINIVLENLSSDLKEYSEDMIDEMIETENDWLAGYVENPLDIDFNYPDPAKAAQMLNIIPIAAAVALNTFGPVIADRLRDIYKSVISSSYITGASTSELLEQYQPRLNSFERGYKAEGETIGESLSGQYDRIVFTKNDKKIKGYVWSAILDTSTCVVCGMLDGKKFNDISKVPMYPQHLRCRCVLIPYTEDMEDVLPETYQEWFEKQSTKDKRAILGKTRFQLYEQGMKIKNFVNNGKKTPLKDLNK